MADLLIEAECVDGSNAIGKRCGRRGGAGRRPRLIPVVLRWGREATAGAQGPPAAAPPDREARGRPDAPPGFARRLRPDPPGYRECLAAAAAVGAGPGPARRGAAAVPHDQRDQRGPGGYLPVGLPSRVRTEHDQVDAGT